MPGPAVQVANLTNRVDKAIDGASSTRILTRDVGYWDSIAVSEALTSRDVSCCRVVVVAEVEDADSVEPTDGKPEVVVVEVEEEAISSTLSRARELKRV